MSLATLDRGVGTKYLESKTIKLDLSSKKMFKLILFTSQCKK